MDTSGIADILSITVPMMAQKQALAEQQETVICAAAQTCRMMLQHKLRCCTPLGTGSPASGI